MAKIKELLVKYREIIVYLVFGVLTTLVDFVFYEGSHSLLHISAMVSNVIAWVAAVAFAFLTNKPIVFKSNDWSWKVVGPELWKFIGCRVGTLILSTVFIAVTVDWLGFHSLLMKAIISVAVVILNYIGSKLLFKQK